MALLGDGHEMGTGWSYSMAIVEMAYRDERHGTGRSTSVPY